MLIRRLKEELATHWRRTLYIMFFAELMTSIGFSSVVPFMPLYIKDELVSSTNLSVELLAGLVYSGQAFTMMIASPFWGSLADRFSRKIMVERAMFGGSAVLLLMAFVGTAEELILLRMLQGLITGTVAAANALVAAETPREHTGYAMGLLQGGLAGGVSVGPLVGGIVADTLGYRAAFYVTGGLLFLAGAMVLVWVRETAAPQDTGNIDRRSFIGKWRDILALQGVRMAYMLRFLTRLGRMMLIPVVPLFVATLLPSGAQVNTFTGMVLAASWVTLAVSGVYLGRLGDRVGHRRIIIAAALLAALLYFPQSLVTAGWQLLALQAMVGVALGGIIPVISTLLASYTQIGEEGAVYGLDNSINSGARVVAPMLASGVMLWFGLRPAFVAIATVFLIAGLLALWRLPRPQPKAAQAGQLTAS